MEGAGMVTAAARNRYVSDSVGTMSPGRLIVALYERLLLDLDRAEQTLATHDIEESHAHLLHAQDIVNELHDSLDESRWDGAGPLGEIYRYVLEELIAANLHKDIARVVTCRTVIVPLRDAWRDAAGIGGG